MIRLCAGACGRSCPPKKGVSAPAQCAGKSTAKKTFRPSHSSNQSNLPQRRFIASGTTGHKSGNSDHNLLLLPRFNGTKQKHPSGTIPAAEVTTETNPLSLFPAESSKAGQGAFQSYFTVCILHYIKCICQVFLNLF